MSALLVNVKGGVDDTVKDLPSLIASFDKKKSNLSQRDQARIQKLRESLNECPKPHLQCSATTDDCYAPIPQCPDCQVIDLRYGIESSPTSCLVITKSYAGSGHNVVCVPCSKSSGNRKEFRFYNGKDMWWANEPEQNCFRLSRTDYQSIMDTLK